MGGRDERCDRCRFWHSEGLDLLDEAAKHPEDIWGECRRRAPLPVVYEGEQSPVAEWPGTAGHYWCGEFEPAPPREGP